MPAFVFDPTVFVQPGYEQADGDWSEDLCRQIEQLRIQHKELKHWGNLAIGCAWGSFSQDIMAIGWLYEGQMDYGGYNRDFIAYIYVRQLAPVFDFLGTGLYSEDIYQLALKEPWHGDTHVAPAWASR